MNKTIDTLVADTYAVLEANADKGGDVLRMSTLGEKCTRKLWYKQNTPRLAEPLPGRTLLSFDYGHMVEEKVFSLIEKAGHKVVGRQDEVTLEGVKGHIDGIIDGVLVDVKSANSRGMEKFKSHNLEKDDPFGYLTQLNAYHAALIDDPRLENKTQAAFLAVDKELGHLVLDTYEMKPRPWKGIIDKLRAILSVKDQPPPRAFSSEPHQKSGNEQIPLQCRYCQFKTECWKDSNGGRGLRKFWFSDGPRWLTKVLREPKVNEENSNNTKGQGLGQEVPGIG